MLCRIIFFFVLCLYSVCCLKDKLSFDCSIKKWPCTFLLFNLENMLFKVETAEILSLSLLHPDEESQATSLLIFGKLQLGIVKPQREEDASGHQTKEIAFCLFNTAMWLSSICAPVTIHHSLSHQTCSLRGSNCHFATRWSVPRTDYISTITLGKRRKEDNFSLGVVPPAHTLVCRANCCALAKAVTTCDPRSINQNIKY